MCLCTPNTKCMKYGKSTLRVKWLRIQNFAQEPAKAKFAGGEQGDPSLYFSRESVR